MPRQKITAIVYNILLTLPAIALLLGSVQLMEWLGLPADHYPALAVIGGGPQVLYMYLLYHCWRKRQ